MQPSLEVWQEYIETHVGFFLPKNQHQWLANAIKQVANSLNMSSETLFARLKTDPALHQKLIDGVLITESHFFRDKQAFDYVCELYGNALTANDVRPFVVASVGCAAGQEVWSLVMALEQKKQAHRLMTTQFTRDFLVAGLDANQRILDVAKKASYPAHTKREIPSGYHVYLNDQADGSYQVVDLLKTNARFVWANVFDERQFLNTMRANVREKPSVIVCQNMLVYFRRFDQRDILSRLVAWLDEGGYLILGAGDGLFWQHEQMQRVMHPMVNVWQKTTR